MPGNDTIATLQAAVQDSIASFASSRKLFRSVNMVMKAQTTIYGTCIGCESGVTIANHISGRRLSGIDPYVLTDLEWMTSQNQEISNSGNSQVVSVGIIFAELSSMVY